MSHFFRLKRYPGRLVRDLAGLGEKALAHVLGDASGITELTVVGPIPVHVAEAERLFRTGRIPSALPASGWRVLLLRGQDPAAVFDMTKDPRVSCVRGKAAASALLKALFVAYASARQRGIPARSRELRVLVAPDAVANGLWLPGRPAILVPLRLGRASRPDPVAMPTGEFLAAVERAFKAKRKKTPRRPPADREKDRGPDAMRLAAIAGLMTLVGCSTTLHVNPMPEAGPARGIAYALPFVQYEITVSRRLYSCTEQPYVRNHVKAANRLLPDPAHSYAIDHTSLSSFMKTSKLGVETYANGTVKEISAEAEDRTGQAATNIASAAIDVAVAAATGGAFGGGPAKRVPATTNVCTQGASLRSAKWRKRPPH